jgi:hypothetical protein
VCSWHKTAKKFVKCVDLRYDIMRLQQDQNEPKEQPVATLAFLVTKLILSLYQALHQHDATGIME